MFKKNIIIKGKHADYMKKMAAIIDSNTNQKLFERNIDIYIFAPIVGMIYGRTSVVDNEYKDDTSIHTEQLQRELDVLTYNYRLIMLLADRDKLSIDERMDRAFRYDNEEEKRKISDDIFEKYVLGGIEILYEKIMEDAKEIDDYLRNIYTFINDFNERYNKLIENEGIYELCRLASD
ncbi:MAG: hypothetical protein JG777_2152 [Clostridia bacterium]|jgi:hypothetical protein|nr:hypothetical protein [Clostridia bacterium]